MKLKTGLSATNKWMEGCDLTLNSNRLKRSEIRIPLNKNQILKKKIPITKRQASKKMISKTLNSKQSKLIQSSMVSVTRATLKFRLKKLKK